MCTCILYYSCNVGSFPHKKKLPRKISVCSYKVKPHQKCRTIEIIITNSGMYKTDYVGHKHISLVVCFTCVDASSRNERLNTPPQN